MKNLQNIHRILYRKSLNTYLRLVLVAVCMLVVVNTSAQTDSTQLGTSRRVEGMVIDANSKQPISAAQIRALSSNTAAVSDSTGRFLIAVNSMTDILLVSAYDYNPSEVAVRGGSQVEVKLYPDVFSLNYKTVKVVNGEKRVSYMPQAARGVENVGSTTGISVDEVIQTRLGGDVKATSRSGLSGIGAALFIRGYNSLNLNAQPLFVVDGVLWNNLYDIQSINDGYYGNNLADINVNDIESVTVMKDGTSIYGAKGANGVIMIETKRGKNMATTMTANMMFGVYEEPSSLPVMNGDQFRIYATELMGSAGLTNDQINDLPFLEDDPNKVVYPTYHSTTNWDDYIYQRGSTQSYNFSFNGGDEKALYNMSLGYTGNKGAVQGTDMSRINTRINGDFNFTKQIKLGLNIGFSNIRRNLLDDGANYYTSPTYLAMIKSPFLSPYEYSTYGELTSDEEDSDIFGTGNPTAVIRRANNSNNHYHLNLGLLPSVKISPSFTVSTLFDYSLDKVQEAYFSPMVGVARRLIPGYGYSENNPQSQQMRNIQLYDDTQLKYNHQFGSNHNLNALLGFRYTNSYYEMDFVESHNTGTDEKAYVQFGSDYRRAFGVNNEEISLSNYVNIDYDFDKRVFLTASIAVDGSSKFGKETKGGFQMGGSSWGVFPSANAAWLISSEKFMRNVKFVDQLKLRGGYGLSGNDNLDAYAWSSYFNAVQYMGNANGLVLGNIANTEIQWETSAKATLGLETVLFNDRLTLNADVYNSHTTNLLGLKAYEDVAGLDKYWSNEGELMNTGYEVSAIVKVLNAKSLRWEIGASIGHYMNEIVALPDGDYSTFIYGGEVRTAVGLPAGVFYGYKTNGVFATQVQAEAANLKKMDEYGVVSNYGAGDMNFDDLDGNGFINELDKQVIGDPNPDFYGSFTSKIGFKNLTLDALFTYSYGNEIYNHLRSRLESGSNYSNQTTAMLTRWSVEGQVTDMPKAVYGDPMGNARFSDRWIEDGSYLKLKSLTLNYKVPLNSNVVENLNIWVAGSNLWTLTNYLGRDPEVSAANNVLYQGIDNGLLPSTKSFYMGVRFNL